MKLKELFESRDLEPPFTISEEQFNSLPEVSPSNVESAFKVQNVAFSQRKGLGGTPNNQNIEYIGFVMELKPSTFLSLALDADRSEDAKKFVGFIKQRAPLASPTFYISINEEEYEAGKPLLARVTGHEGRGRMWAIDSVNGNTPTPVHCVLGNGMRARNLSTKFFEDLRSVGLVAEGEKINPKKIPIGRIFWMGQQL